MLPTVSGLQRHYLSPRVYLVCLRPGGWVTWHAVTGKVARGTHDRNVKAVV